jgi:hypothetical protein
VYAHCPERLVRPVWQDSAYVPPLYTCPAAHASPSFAPVQSPDTPQQARSVIGSTRLPLQ